MTDHPETTSTAVPHSRDSEEATIGSVLINPEIYYDCAAVVKPDDFYIHRNKWIWEAFCSLVEQHTPIDLLTVSDELDRRGRLAEIGGPAYLTELINHVPSSLNAEAYAQIVAGYSVRRKMLNAANNIAALVYNDIGPLEDAISETWTSIESAVEKAAPNSMRHISEVVSENYDNLDEMCKTQDNHAIPTGLIDLDKHLRIRPGNLVTIAARPGIGKTGLAVTIGVNVSKKQHRNVAFFTLEMSSNEIGNRIIAQEAEIDLFRLMDGKLDESEWPVYTHVVETMSNTGLYIYDNSDVTVPQIRAECKKLKARHGLDLVVVDYGGLIESPGNTPNDRASYTSRQLKKLAKALGVPVLMLWQMNREIEKRGDGEPQLSDLRDSGSIEQDSDTVVFLYVKGEDVPGDQLRTVKCSIAKQRNGPTHKLDLAMRIKSTKFENAAMFRTK